MLTRRQLLSKSLGTIAGLGITEWSIRPILFASDDKDTVKIIRFSDSGEKIGPTRVKKVRKTDAEWKLQLTPLQFEGLRSPAKPRCGEFHSGTLPAHTKCY